MSADDYDDLVSSNFDDGEESDSGGSCAADVAKGAALGATSAASVAVVSGAGTGPAAVIGAATGATTAFVASDNCAPYKVDAERAVNDYSEAMGMP